MVAVAKCTQLQLYVGLTASGHVFPLPTLSTSWPLLACSATLQRTSQSRTTLQPPEQHNQQVRVIAMFAQHDVGINWRGNEVRVTVMPASRPRHPGHHSDTIVVVRTSCGSRHPGRPIRGEH